MTVDRDVWTCPRCEQTVRGNAKVRRTAQRDHARRHGVPFLRKQPPLKIPPKPPAPLRKR